MATDSEGTDSPTARLDGHEDGWCNGCSVVVSTPGSNVYDERAVEFVVGEQNLRVLEDRERAGR